MLSNVSLMTTSRTGFLGSLYVLHCNHIFVIVQRKLHLDDSLKISCFSTNLQIATNMASSLSFSTELTQISSQTSTAQPITETMQQNSNKADREKVIASRETDPNLSPADGGKHAWLFLAGCFVFEALIWGK